MLQTVATSGRPTAIRAVASDKATWFGRHKRVLRFDARYLDGRVETDVNADTVLNGQHLPADAWANP
jgi:hypothetical protein